VAAAQREQEGDDPSSRRSPSRLIPGSGYPFRTRRSSASRSFVGRRKGEVSSVDGARSAARLT